jgi:transposase
VSRSFEWYLGVDWGGTEHVIVLLDRTGHKHGTWHVPHTAAAVHAFLAERLTQIGRETVAVGLETPRGVIVDAVLEQRLAVFAVNPKQLDRFRDRHTTAGAKDDRLDAYVIADALRTDPQCFREVQPDPAQVTELREYTRMLEELDRDHRRGANQVREQILRVAPEWLTLSDGADEPWFWALLEKIVRPTGAKPLRRTAVARLLQHHRIRRWSVDDVLRAIDAPRWTPADGTWAAVHAHVEVLLARLRLLQRQRATCEADLDRLLRRCAEESEGQPGGHRDVSILQSLPGVGRKTAAAMLAYAARHLADRDYPTLRSYLGVAPVTKRSGKRYYVVQMRYACHTRLRTVVHCWAGASLRLDAAARRYYDQLRQRGCTHARALRSVGDRWLRILIAMLRTQETYNPAKLRSAVGN